MTEQIEIPESFPGPGAVAAKRVVIGGAGRGFGPLLAHACSHAGASVALLARTDRLPGTRQFLASDGSAFVAGTVLRADGGYFLV